MRGRRTHRGLSGFQTVRQGEQQRGLTGCYKNNCSWGVFLVALRMRPRATTTNNTGISFSDSVFGIVNSITTGRALSTRQFLSLRRS